MTLMDICTMRKVNSIQVLRLAGLVLFAFFVADAFPAAFNSGLAAEPNEPYVAPASDDGERAISRIRTPAGLKLDLWAAEPMLANPVAISIDERGRIYVAETYRQKHGAEDNREHGHWLDDDLAAMTVEDRLAYFWKYLGERVWDYTREQDRIRLLEDCDGDGKADVSTVFAGGFNAVLEGIGAGVLARHGTVWYTNVPHLWLLRDEDGDGQADVRTPLHAGYGVRVAFRGHDLHGLTFGPDGRLYFSMGDRGLNVTTPEGRRLVCPDRGAVLRCNPDGSELEVFATGLRNPQELAFDQYGNLFTCDNNSDSGDKARWVYVVEEGDSGWRMSFQYLPDRGPWNREKLWHPQYEGQPAYIIPPIINLADGPSGLAFYPGVGLPEQYNNHFFLVDFRGAFANSGVRSFAVKPKGASFELVDSQEFLWSILATDVDFGPDGAMYVSDWVETWDGAGKGRIYRLTDPSAEQDAQIAEARALIRDGLSQRSDDELARLLAHPHRQVRLEAQFALAKRRDAAVNVLTHVAVKNDRQLARLHALWGLGQIGRKQKSVLRAVLPLLSDADSEVRSQAAKVLGDCEFAEAAAALAALLGDPEPRVRFFAAMAYGRMRRAGGVRPILEMLRENADRDLYLRHAAVVALSRTPFASDLVKAADDPSPALRMGVLLALRRSESREVALFLNDSESRIVEEAARAIHDVPIDDAMPQLAALAGRPGLSEATLYRVINANFRLGDASHAQALAAIAADAALSDAIRSEAVSALGDWATPSGRDRVLGSWRPLPKREAEPAATAFRAKIAGIFSGSARVAPVATRVAAKLEIKEVGPVLLKLLSDSEQAPQTRVEALEALAGLRDPKLPEAIERALEDAHAEVRVAGRKVFARLQPEAALTELEETLESGELIEKQSAFTLLGEIKGSKSQEMLIVWLDKALAGNLPVEFQLDLLEAAAKRPFPPIQKRLKDWKAAIGDDPLASRGFALAGGNPDRGRRVFFERSDLSCVRCHKINDRGGEVGPDLSKIGSQQKRDYLLEALVLPDKQIAKGFDPVVIVTESGKVHSGIIRQDDGKQIHLMTAEGSLVLIPKDEIDEQSRGRSAMPDDLIKKLSSSELRDLVEFLAQLK
jgi:quinoprotein glucose dehydrogenase